MKTVIGLMLAVLLPATATAAPCVTWKYPTQRVDGTPLTRFQLAGVVIHYKRVMRSTGTTYTSKTHLMNPITPKHCFRFTAVADYTFWAVAHDKNGLQSAPSATVTWSNPPPSTQSETVAITGWGQP